MNGWATAIGYIGAALVAVIGTFVTLRANRKSAAISTEQQDREALLNGYRGIIEPLRQELTRCREESAAMSGELRALRYRVVDLEATIKELRRSIGDH